MNSSNTNQCGCSEKHSITLRVHSSFFTTLVLVLISSTAYNFLDFLRSSMETWHDFFSNISCHVFHVFSYFAHIFNYSMREISSLLLLLLILSFVEAILTIWLLSLLLILADSLTIGGLVKFRRILLIEVWVLVKLLLLRISTTPIVVTAATTTSFHVFSS